MVMIGRVATRHTTAMGVLFSLVLGTPLLAEKERSFAPVATVVLTPREAAADTADDELPSKPIAIEELRPYDKETWERIKAAAVFDPRAEKPDSIVPPPVRGNKLLAPFDGLGFQQIHPPDTSVARSGQRILQVVNSQINLYNSTGILLNGRTLQNFFSSGGFAIPPIDPQVLYDRNTANPRFFVTATTWNDTFSTGLLAVSRSADPSDLNAGNWCVYGFTTHDDFSGSGVPTLMDQPRIGVGADTVTIAGNLFTIQTLQFRYALITVLNKLQLENNAAGCQGGSGEIFRPAAAPGDLNVFSLQPAVHYNSPSSFAGTSNPSYLVNTRSGNSSTYWIWRVRNTLNGANPGNLQMTSVVGNFQYAIPLDAPQQGSAIKLDTGDPRVLQVGGVGDSLWAVHGTNCNTGGGPSEVCARVVRIDMSQNLNAPVATLNQQTTFSGGVNIHYWMPSIAVNQSHRTAVPFLWSSASTYLSSAWTAKNAATGSYPAAQALGSGTCKREESSPTGRTGDYVGAQTDPTDFLTFWISAEHASVYPPPPAGNTCTWLTRIGQVN